jgi:AcrR family transcriptional regulator
VNYVSTTEKTKQERPAPGAGQVIDPDPSTGTVEEAAGEGRPMRADAKRNYDKVVGAARLAFAETGAETSLEAVARRAGVGIGTLYRHFPTRQALLEAVYIGEVQQLCSATQQLLGLPPWESFVELSHRLMGYLATKKALAHELMNYVDRESAFFKSCRADLFVAGEPILRRAQEAGVVRTDTDFTELIQLIGGIAKIEETAPGQRDHILDIALDGLRHRG